MSNRVSIARIEKGVTRRMDEMLARAKASEQFFTRVIKKAYLNTQQSRWKTENAFPFCAGGEWTALDSKYAERKKRDFAGFPGQGRLMMIATGRLYDSIMGKSKDYREIVTNRSIAWATTVPYAKYANEARTFSAFSKDFYGNLGKFYSEYVAKGKL
jgi:hypothetical protein